jgi:6-pyruvoyl-tetrahydropterin synthase
VPYRIVKSIDLDFAHHVGGHQGACINIHGHTWKFEVGLEADLLDSNGFVIDFKLLRTAILQPVHDLLDHSLAIYEGTYDLMVKPLTEIGCVLLNTRAAAGEVLGYKVCNDELAGANQQITGGLKVAVFPFSPTSERLAYWLFQLAHLRLESIGQTPRVKVTHASIYETLHPVEAVATFSL